MLDQCVVVLLGPWLLHIHAIGVIGPGANVVGIGNVTQMIGSALDREVEFPRLADHAAHHVQTKFHPELMGPVGNALHAAGKIGARAHGKAVFVQAPVKGIVPPGAQRAGHAGALAVPTVVDDKIFVAARGEFFCENLKVLKRVLFADLDAVTIIAVPT